MLSYVTLVIENLYHEAFDEMVMNRYSINNVGDRFEVTIPAFICVTERKVRKFSVRIGGVTNTATWARLRKQKSVRTTQFIFVA